MVAIGEVYLNYSHIPAVNIRGAADYVTPPLRRRKDGTWEERSEFTERLNGGDAMTTEGYRYAIKTTSMYTINLFRVRKLAKDRKQGGGLSSNSGGRRRASASASASASAASTTAAATAERTTAEGARRGGEEGTATAATRRTRGRSENHKKRSSS